MPRTASDGIQEIDVTDDSMRMFATSALTIVRAAAVRVEGAGATARGDARHPAIVVPTPIAEFARRAYSRAMADRRRRSGSSWPTTT